MKLNILILFIYILFSNQIKIKNGVYNLITNNLYLCYNKRYLSLTDEFKHPNTFFRIFRANDSCNDSFYYIEEIYTKYNLNYLETKELIFNRKNNILNLWNFIEITQNSFVIQNQDNCYVLVNKYKAICDKIPLDQATQFKIIKIYNEVYQKKNCKLLENEPIDIFIKYIDLRDPNLNRNGIHQIEKDYDNEELRYSVRSILQNIPWVRKIFILMPNEKVRYFKDYNYINEKIIYVKDKELLGYDSSNSLAFQYRIWKMKKFGISDNIIVMDDDCFISNKLEKSDFFYVKNGNILPLIITSNFIKINWDIVNDNLHFYESKAKKSKEEQNNDIFNYSKYLTFSFILELFNTSLKESLFLPKFTHNAIPINLKDIKEVYDHIYFSPYKYKTLDSIYRQNEILQFQMLILSYTFVKYERRVKNIPYQFMNINGSIPLNKKYSLLCINKGAGNYTYIDFFKAKIFMEYLFPFPSPYEIVDYSLINLSFNIVYSMNNKIKEYEIRSSQIIFNYSLYYLKFDIILFIILLLIKFNFFNNYYDY